jgi:hypothetical protein
MLLLLLLNAFVIDLRAPVHAAGSCRSCKASLAQVLTCGCVATASCRNPDRTARLCCIMTGVNDM